MAPQGDSFQRRVGVEHLLVDRDLRIVSLSEGAPCFAEDPASAVPGEDVRLGFPEFVGAERDLLDLLLGQRLSWSLTAVCRSHFDGELI